MRFAIVIEKANGNYSAYAPDLPGCIATGKTPDEVRERMDEAIQFHLEGMKQEGVPVPEPTSEVIYIDWTPAEVEQTSP